MIPSTLPADAVLVALVGILVQLLKPWLELAVPPTNKEHDPLIRLLAVLLAVALILVQRGIPADGPAVISLLGYALGTALAAIGAYHLVTGSASPTVMASVATGPLPTGAANSALDLPPSPATHPDHTFTYTFPPAGTSAPASPASDTAHVTVSTPTSVTTETIPAAPSPSPEPPATADRPASPPSA